jgi:hypothetical protein
MEMISIGTADSVTVLLRLREPITITFSKDSPLVAIVTFTVAPFTVTDFVSIPIKENCKTSPKFALIEYFPSKSDVVPFFDPLTIIVTPGKIALDSDYVPKTATNSKL